MSNAPIIIFAFNRLESLKHTVSSLLQNEEAAVSDLFVFVDGARPNINGEDEKVHAVQDYVKTITGFKRLTYTFSDSNKGLGPSIISGVTDVINKYGRAIVLEDDLYVARGFLSYMNTMLEAYEQDHRIMQISGFSTKVKLPQDYPYDIYLNRRGESWSWGTWKDRWNSIDWDLKDYDEIKNDKALQRRFNDIGSDLFDMLRQCAEEGAKLWAVKFCYAMFRNGCYQVSPVKSLVRNDGFGEESTNCNSYNRYKYIFNNTQTVFTPVENLSYNSRLDQSANRFWTIKYRIWGKLMSLFKQQ